MTIGGGLNVPIPDPSTLTTEQLRRELLGLRDLLESRLESQGLRIDHISELSRERIEAVNAQFKERDIRSEMADKASDSAIRAALETQKEAAAKAEANSIAAMTKADASVTKQIDSINALLNTGLANVNDKIAVINGRLDKGEGGSHANANSTTMAIAIGAVLVSLIIGVFTAINGAHIATNTVPSAPPIPTTQK